MKIAFKSAHVDSIDIRPGTTAAAGWSWFMDRMQGPGGYYNTGNLLAFGTGLGLQLAQGVSQTTIAAAVADFLFGNISSSALTVATLIFVLSGETYHRAWADGYPPSRKLNQIGDLLSGVGALFLGVGILLLDQWALALTSGLMHAMGKLGSASLVQMKATHPDLSRICRVMVMLSRLPAMAAAAMGVLASGDILQEDPSGMALFASSSLLVSYALWAKADLLLLKS